MNITNTNEKPADALLTDKEVAQILKASIATVWRRVSDGTLPKPIKIGNLSRFLQSDVLGLIETAKTRRAA